MNFFVFIINPHHNILMMAEKHMLGDISVALPSIQRKSKSMTRFNILLIMGTSLILFLLLGWMFFGSIASYCKGTSNTLADEWGQTVTVDGQNVPVKDYISSNIIPENIKENLRLG